MPDKTSASKLGVFSPDTSVFVSANAGAGKTSLLTNRVLSLLLHGAQPSSILCLTFTNAAAAEMKSRVQSVLGHWVMASDESLVGALQEILNYTPDARQLRQARSLFASVLEMPDGIRIQTIHGFCQSLLRRFPLEAHISPHFTVIDSRTEQEILREARLRLLMDTNDRNPELQNAITYLAQQGGEYGLNNLLAEIIQHKRKFVSLFHTPGGVKYIEERLFSSLGVAQNVDENDLVRQHFKYDVETLTTLRQTADVLLQGEKTDHQTGDGLATWLEHQENIEEYLGVFLTASGEPRKKLYTVKTLTDTVLIEALLAEQQRVLAYSKARNVLSTATHTRYGLRIIQQFLALYDGLKRGRSAMDYDDLIVTASELLGRENVSPWILYKLDGGIDHILVDEAQDTSPEQWKIIDTLAQEFFSGEGRKQTNRSLFVVGDEKQSIYSFQGADVDALSKMQKHFSKRIHDAAINVQEVALTHSYRSTPEVLRAVDLIFSHEDTRKGLTSSHEDLKHSPIRIDQPGLVELWPLLRPEEQSSYAPTTLLVRHIAEQIRGWLKDGIMLEAKDRKLRPGDIMVLVRKRGKIVDALTRALKRQNIPVSGIDRMRLSDDLAIQDLMALGKALLLPTDDLTLASLLKSPIFNLSEEELFELAWNREEHTLWARLRQLAQTDENYSDAYNLLSDLRAKVDYVSPFELYSYVLDSCGARRKFIGRMGQECADPIDEFLNQALLYERSHSASMQGFIHWLETSDNEIKRDMEQSNNAVRIMTVHGAKGLQAPVVILPDTVDVPRQADRLLWYDDKTISIPLFPQASAFEDELSANIRAQQKELMLAEHRRLFYVALTRAEDRLYICGATSKKTINEQSWYHMAHTGLQNNADTYEAEHGIGLRMGTPPQSDAASAVENQEEVKNAAIYDFSFLDQPPPVEPTPSRPLSPSKLAGDEPAAASPSSGGALYQRGVLIHRLLQYLPSVQAEKYEEVAQNLAGGFSEMPEEIRLESIAEVIRVLQDPKHAFLFSKGSLAEVPVAGNVTIDGRVISVAGQIDRLSISDDTVWIVDYKSNIKPVQRAEDISMVYLRQLLLYKLLLEQIYPQKDIKCALLWTANCQFMSIDDALLDESALSSYI